MDVMKLMMSDYEVQIGDANSPRDFYVKFNGPKNSPYEGGIWKVHVTLPQNYPYSSPSIGFCNTIYHPNVDQASGSVCLDVINQTWSPMFDLVNVFSVFLPQLLLYPNPSDPLNGEAAALLLQDKASYSKKVQEFVKKFAAQDIKVRDMEDEEDEHDDDDEGTSTSTSSGSGKTPSAAIAAAKKKSAKKDDEDEDENLSDIDDEPEVAGEMVL